MSLPCVAPQSASKITPAHFLTKFLGNLLSEIFFLNRRSFSTTGLPYNASWGLKLIATIELEPDDIFKRPRMSSLFLKKSML